MTQKSTSRGERFKSQPSHPARHSGGVPRMYKNECTRDSGRDWFARVCDWFARVCGNFCCMWGTPDYLI